MTANIVPFPDRIPPRPPAQFDLMVQRIKAHKTGHAAHLAAKLLIQYELADCILEITDQGQSVVFDFSLNTHPEGALRSAASALGWHVEPDRALWVNGRPMHELRAQHYSEGIMYVLRARTQGAQ